MDAQKSMLTSQIELQLKLQQKLKEALADEVKKHVQLKELKKDGELKKKSEQEKYLNNNFFRLMMLQKIKRISITELEFAPVPKDEVVKMLFDEYDAIGVKVREFQGYASEMNARGEINRINSQKQKILSTIAKTRDSIKAMNDKIKDLEENEDHQMTDAVEMLRLKTEELEMNRAKEKSKNGRVEILNMHNVQLKKEVKLKENMLAKINGVPPKAAGGSTLPAAGGSTLPAAGGSTLKAAEDSTLATAGGSAMPATEDDCSVSSPKRLEPEQFHSQAPRENKENDHNYAAKTQ